MKLIVQIPVWNEEELLPRVLDDVQKNLGVPGFGSAGIIIVDDGSGDRSVALARKAGVLEVVRLGVHRGLGVAFREGLRRALELDADVIVNTDADFQYNASQLHDLVRLVVEGQADMAIGNRFAHPVPGYPRSKRMAQAAGNFLVSKLLGADVRDATSGFRAVSRDAAQLLVENLKNPYTYTLESLGILINRDKRVAFVPVDINAPLRPSRLIRNRARYVGNYLATAFRYAAGRQTGS